MATDLTKPTARSGNAREDVRAAILASAVRLFYERGYQATSVSDVVEDAGYTKGAFYYYFKSKETLLVEIHDDFVREGIRSTSAILAGNHTPEEALTLLIRELVRHVGIDRAQMTIVLQEARHISFDKFPEAKRNRDEYDRLVVAILERGIGAREFREDLLSTRVLAFGIIGMCVWAYQWFSPSGPLSTAQIAEMFTTVLLDGLRRPA